MGLSWTAPGGSPSVSYHVYEGTSPGFALGNPVVSTTGTSATVTGLTNGTSYYFVVTAVGSDGTASGASGEASAQPTTMAVLASATGKVPKPVIALLAVVAVVAIAAAAALTARRLRKRRRPPAAPPADVRAVPEPGLVAGIHAGRLAGIHAGRGHIGVALTIHELEVLTKRTHLELPGVKALERGFRLLPASAYPDESHGQPGTDPGAGHPASAETDHPSASWWEKPQPGRA